MLNLISSDLSRIRGFFEMLPGFLYSTSTIFFNFTYLFFYIGFSTTFGFIALIILSVYNFFSFKYMGKYVLSYDNLKDERIRNLSEVIKNIQIIKLFAWESIFEKKINAVRDDEIDKLKKKNFFRISNLFIYISAPFIFSSIIFIFVKNNLCFC
jgi:ATP-binding cassette, subfamily C (CFTR/MRP), member 1